MDRLLLLRTGEAQNDNYTLLQKRSKGHNIAK